MNAIPERVQQLVNEIARGAQFTVGTTHASEAWPAIRESFELGLVDFYSIFSPPGKRPLGWQLTEAGVELVSDKIPRRVIGLCNRLAKPAARKRSKVPEAVYEHAQRLRLVEHDDEAGYTLSTRGRALLAGLL